MCDSMKQENNNNNNNKREKKDTNKTRIRAKGGNSKREIDRAKGEEEKIGMGRRLAAEEINVRGSGRRLV